MEICKCEKGDYWYFPSINEEGWKCLNCNGLFPGEPAGYSPTLDVERIDDKVNGLLLDLHEAGFCHISNGSEGDVLVRMISNRCKNENRFDQDAIFHFYYDLTWHSHSDYWRKIGMGIRAGNDPRERCHCGKLANCWVNGKEYCSDHHPSFEAAA